MSLQKRQVKDSTSDWFTEVSFTEMQEDREGYVQVATVNLASPFVFPASHGQDAEPFDGWRVTHDEPSLDRLIKALTEAKKKAFGPQLVAASPD